MTYPSPPNPSKVGAIRVAIRPKFLESSCVHCSASRNTSGAFVGGVTPEFAGSYRDVCHQGTPYSVESYPTIVEDCLGAVGSFPSALGSFPEVLGSFPEVLGSYREVSGSYPEVLGSCPEVLGGYRKS